jgi:hypothetical protein
LAGAVCYGAVAARPGGQIHRGARHEETLGTMDIKQLLQEMAERKASDHVFHRRRAHLFER